MAKTQTATQTQQQQSKAEAPPSRKPIHEVRLGKVKASVWQNSTDNGVFYHVTFGRLYKDEAAWRVADSFGRDDLPALASVANQAWLWIFQKQQEPE